MREQNIEEKRLVAHAPQAVADLKGNAVRAQFVNLFNEVQWLKNQLDQYTDLSVEQKAQIDPNVPPDQLQAFEGACLKTAKRRKKQRAREQATLRRHRLAQRRDISGLVAYDQ